MQSRSLTWIFLGTGYIHGTAAPVFCTRKTSYNISIRPFSPVNHLVRSHRRCSVRTTTYYLRACPTCGKRLPLSKAAQPRSLRWKVKVTHTRIPVLSPTSTQGCHRLRSQLVFQ
ncbi:hypothetical protein BJ912DRAFT_698392 [Pholiota molesta]|nr:hypothetical protein BJ912DRAFT_698392 [Pholiota molesta]